MYWIILCITAQMDVFQNMLQECKNGIEILLALCGKRHEKSIESL